MEEMLKKYLTNMPASKRRAFIEKYGEAYKKMYRDEVEVGLDLLNEIVEMHIVSNTKISTLTHRYLLKFMYNGILVDDVQAYRHMKHRQQIIKLLRPDYEAQYDCRRITEFTKSIPIYNIAVERYDIPKKYKISASLWYTKKLASEGVIATPMDLYNFIECNSLASARYLLDNNLVTNYDLTLAAKRSIMNGNCIHNLHFLVDVGCEMVAIIKYADRYNPNLVSELGPLMQVLGNDIQIIVTNRLTDALRQLVRLDVKSATKLLFDIIDSEWVEGLKIVIHKLKITVDHLFRAADTYNIESVTLIYNKILNKIDAGSVLMQIAIKYTFDIFMCVYKLNPLDLKNILDISKITDTDTLDYCISMGC